MMTGMLGVVMWLMMGLMLVGIVTGGITWAMRRLRGRPPVRRRRRRPRRPCAGAMLTARSTVTSTSGANATSPSTDCPKWQAAHHCPHAGGTSADEHWQLAIKAFSGWPFSSGGVLTRALHRYRCGELW